MRKTTAPGNSSNEFVDYEEGVTAGTVVDADWLNDVQDELLGVQEAMSIAEATGTNEYVAAAIIGMSIRYGTKVGFIEADFGSEVQSPAAFDEDDPTAFFPKLCLTDFTASKAIDVANWPDLVPVLRAKRLRYLDQITGDTVEFAGSASGSVITLTDTTANNDLLAALVEFQADFGTYTDWLTLDWDGTTYAITDVDAATREITVTGTPTAGAGNVTIYPHRIAGSTTTARVHSAVGKDIRAAGTAEYLAGLMWRDQMQQITGGKEQVMARNETDSGAISGSSLTLAADFGTTNKSRITNLTFDSANSPNARTGTTTRGAGMGVHFYLHGGRYAA